MKEKKSKKKAETKKKKREFPFFNFMMQKSQALDFAIILGSCLLAYIGIRYFYPYPSTISDSGGYVEAAIQNIFYIYRPFGYSYFLQILHSLTTSIHSIFIVQMLLLFFATSFLAVTVKYFYTPVKKWVWYISLAFLIFTPTSFIMANWIMSDLLFSVQIYFIVSLFIFIIKRESWIAAILYILLIFTALHVRYSALVFPFALLPFFLLKKGKIRWVITLLSVVVFFVFFLQIKKSMKERVKMEQFSTGFDGWVYTSNVLHVLPYIDVNVKDFKDSKLKKFHNFIMEDIDIIKNISDSSRVIGAGFMWNNRLQLKQYLHKTMQEQKTQYLPTFVKLGSTVYKDYAMHIMTHYPLAFLHYYYLPNIKQTFYPHAGCLQAPDPKKPKIFYEYYKIDKENAMQVKRDLFSNPTYHSAMKILHLMMWMTIMGIGVAAFLKRKKLVFSTDDKIVFWGLFCFAVICYASSIFAAPMEIRYTIGMHSIRFVFCYILLNKLFGYAKVQNELKTTEKPQKKSASEKKEFFLFKKIPVVYIVIISIVVLSICAYFMFSSIKVRKGIQTTQIKVWEEEINNPKMSAFIEACKFCKEHLPDSILVITRKPEIFYEFSGNQKALNFPYSAEPDTIISYLKRTKATHIILDDRFRYAYLTLFPAVQKNPEKFKVLKQIGGVDTARKVNPTYVMEFNDKWGYYGERIDGKKTGEGYELFQDGRKYEGNYANDLPEGNGTLYDALGNVIVKGKWRNGMFVGAQ